MLPEGVLNYIYDFCQISKDEVNEIIPKIISSGSNSKSYCIKFKGENILFLKFITDDNRKSIELYESDYSLSYSQVSIPNEFENLSFLSSKGFTSKGMSPNPLFYLKKYNCIGMNFVKGDLFSEKLSMKSLIDNLFKSSISKNFEDISKYLVEFEKTLYNNITKPTKPFANRIIKKELDSISSLSLSRKNIIAKTINDLIEDVQKIPVHFVSTDFKPHNIIVNGKIVGIDWGMCKKNGFAGWMASSFIRLVSFIDRFSIYKNSLKKNFTGNYINDSIINRKTLLLSQIFECIISFAGNNQNKYFNDFHSIYLDDLICRKMI